MRVRWTETALSELVAAISYIDQNSPAGAKAILRRIEIRAKLLGDFPFIGHVSDGPTVRVLPVVRYPFVSFYTVDDTANDVVILHVRHSAQQPIGG